MASFGEADDPRRRLIIQGLAAGLFSALPLAGARAQQSIFGTPPSKLPAGQSIYRLSGKVQVNGQDATLQTPINIGDTVETGKNSEIVFVVGTQAMILRDDSKLTIQGEKKEGASVLAAGLRILSGKILSVSRNQPMTVTTQTATIGIRGTGWYLEADPGETYFCTCYGVTEVAATDDPASKETIAASHHDKPVIITADGQSGQKIRPAGFKNHSDQELMLIETLVGRSTPFVYPGSAYGAPRRGY